MHIEIYPYLDIYQQNLYSNKMQKILISVTVILALAIPINCTLGIDVNKPYSTQTFTCLKQQGHLFAIVQGLQPTTGQVDINAIKTLTNAIQAGLLTDVLLTPCRGKSALDQVSQLMNQLPVEMYDTIWIQVRANANPSCDWVLHDAESNCRYVNQIASVIQSRKHKIGVFSSKKDWQSIFKSLEACPNLAKYPIWYAENNNEGDFSDFAEFGGWDIPRVKQFQVGIEECGAKINRNYHPSA